MFRRSSFNFFDFMSDRHFTAKYHCFAASRYRPAGRGDVDKGGKILLPPTALEALTKYHMSSPMLFQLKNSTSNRSSHAGVLEFIAEEGRCYLPEWLMSNLQLADNDLVDIESVTLPTATFSKFQPMSVDFLDITNPKAVLENALRNFACLTKNDIIAIHYNRRVYHLLVLDTKPQDAVSIIECDMNVEFAAPVGYEVEDQEMEELVESTGEEEIEEFTGLGQRLDGKRRLSKHKITEKKVKAKGKGIADIDYQFGTLVFNRQIVPISDRKKATDSDELMDAETADETNAKEGFEGKGVTL